MIGQVPGHLNLLRCVAEILHIVGGTGVRIYAQTLLSSNLDSARNLHGSLRSPAVGSALRDALPR